MRTEDNKILRRLWQLHPAAIFNNPRKVLPLHDSTIEVLVSMYSSEWSSDRVRRALSFYQESRHYHKAVARAFDQIDLSGMTAAPSSPSAQKNSREWLAKWSISECCRLLKSKEGDIADKLKAVSILEADYRELTALSAISARSPAQTSAFAMRKQMVEIARVLRDAEPRNDRIRDLEYANYYAAVSGCNVALLAHEFSRCRRMASQAEQAASKFLNSLTFFPNFFFDLVEIQSFGEYVSAVECFREGRFDEAGNAFLKWLERNAHREGKGHTSFDSNIVHRQLCVALDTVKVRGGVKDEWNELDRLLQLASLNVSRTTRTLLDHIGTIKGLSLMEERHVPGGRNTIDKFVRQASHYWRLLSPSAPLKGKDRTSRLVEHIKLPHFLDVARIIQTMPEGWQFLLLQITTNVLLIKADYENRMKRGTVIQPQIPLYKLEALTLDELINLIRSRLHVKSIGSLRIFDKAILYLVRSLKEIELGRQNEAITHFDTFHTILRSLPHIIDIESCIWAADTSGGFERYKIQARRAWRYSPQKLWLELEQDLPTGYAYMRPRWNRNIKSHYRTVSSEPIIHTRLPEWMALFERWATGSGPATQDTFLNWCAQFDPHRLPVALRLLTRFTFFSEVDVRESWRSLHTRVLEGNKSSHTLYVGLGKAEKSGVHQLYPARQALLTMGEEGRSNENISFRSADALSDSDESCDTVVFIDDLIGSGTQASRYLITLFENILGFEIVNCAFAR